MPADVRASEHIFNVFDEAGVRLWGQEVEGTIAQAEVADLDGDGIREVIVGVSGAGADTGKILVFDANGAPLWSKDTTAPYPYGAAFSGRMAVYAFVTGDLFGEGKREVVSISIDAQGWYPSRLCIFDSAGKLRASYWHPGHLQKVIIGAATAHGDSRIIAVGVNNDLRQTLETDGYVPIVLVLDPRNVSGEAPPYFGRSKEGTQLWYGAILPTHQTVERLELVDRNQNGIKQISVWMSSRNVLFLDFDGNLTGTGRGDGSTHDVTFGLVVKK
jgi:hypothetical protein